MPGFVNVITTATIEIVEQQHKPMEPILDCVHKDLVEFAPVVLPVERMADVQLKHLVTFL